MKKWKSVAAALLAFSLATGVAGCGSSNYSAMATADKAEIAYEESGWTSSPAAAADEVWEEEAAYEDNGNQADASLSEKEKDSLEADQKTERKLIRNMSYSLETTGLDELLAAIEQKVNELNGYTESSNQNGNKNSSRSAYLTIRVPADRLNEFEEMLGNSATVLSKSSSVRDVTLSYSDLEAHISSLRIEQETLMDMLKKAEDVDTILIIQNELTNIRYELESYESQMKIMQNQISYSTVSIDIREVKIPTAQVKEGFFSRVRYTFANNVSDVLETIEDFFVFFFGNIIGIILFIAVAAVVILILKYVFRLIFGKRPEKETTGEKKRKFFRKIWKRDKAEETVPKVDQKSDKKEE